MSLLTKYTLPAERRRGCVWADRFESEALVEKNSGAATGAPTFDLTNGVTLDGTNDYLIYNMLGHELLSNEYSSVIVFTPHFDADLDAYKIIHDATAGNRFAIVKQHLGDGLGMYFYIGNTFIQTVPYATYSPYWYVNERNVLVVHSIAGGGTGSTRVYLNGNLILSSSTSWTANTYSPASFYVGSSNTGGSRFDGVIHSVKLFNKRLTDEEALSYCSSEAFDYQDKATLHLNMSIDDHDVSYSQLDNDLLTDGDMETSGTGSWTAGNSATLSKESGTRTGGSGYSILRVTRDGTNNPYVYQNILTNGVNYRVSGWVRSGGGSAYPKIYFNSVTAWQGTTSTDWQYFEATATSDGTWCTFQSTTSTGTEYVEWDDITVSQIAIIDGDMELSGTTNWTAGNSATLSKETGTRTGGSGTKVLRITKAGTWGSALQQPLISGKTYRISGWTRSDGTATPKLEVNVLGKGTTNIFTGTTSTEWQPFDKVFPAGASYIGLMKIGGGDYVEFDDVIVAETILRTLDVADDGNIIRIGDGTTNNTGPTKPARRGYDFDGTNDYMSGTISTNVFNSADITIVVEFTPDFDYDANANRWIFDTEADEIYQLVKENNAASNVLTLWLGNTAIASVASATYSPYWLVNRRNVIVISGTTGNTDMWLNGAQILTADNTAWTPIGTDTLLVGVSRFLSGYFDGEIHSLYVVPARISYMQAIDATINAYKRRNLK